ncbi:MAG: hypothetical protein C4291_11795 [Candidatus Dadabacteria bacterium]
MKKRGRIEIKIRNALSGILILSLKFSEESVLLYLILRFCWLIKEKGRIRLTDLLELQGNIIGWVRLGCGEILEKLNSLHIFEIDSEGYIQIEGQFRDYLSDMCIRVGRYWKFISDLYSKGEKFKDGIEGDIKKGILLFNEGFYFECHEFLEEVWRKKKGREKAFLRGLIHSAVAFYHLEYGNYGGAASYLNRVYLGLKGFKPVFLRVDVGAFLCDIGNYLGLIEKSGFDDLEILKSAIPKIGLIE